MFLFILDETLIAAICDCILALGMIGCGCTILRAISNLQKENEALTGCKNFIKTLEKNKQSKKHDDGFKAFTLLYGREHDSNSLQKLLCQNSLLKTSYVSERLAAIISAVSDKNHVRKAPSLNDLHELTLQREQGGKSVGFFRAVTPSILVLGILGTLVGVHNKLDDLNDIRHLSTLATALLPGIMAVVTTIIMIVLRGWYNKNWSEFITKLDNLTLEKILPYFQQQETNDQVTECFADSVSLVLEGENRLDFDEMVKQMQRLNRLTNEWQDIYDKMGQHLIKDDLPTAADCISLLEKNREQIHKHYTRVCTHMKALQEDLCNIYAKNAANLVINTAPLLTVLPDECVSLKEQLERDNPNINNIRALLAKQEKTVKESSFTKRAEEIEARSKSCAQLLDWIQQLPQRVSENYSGVHAHMIEGLLVVQGNQYFITNQMQSFADMQEKYEDTIAQNQKHFESSLGQIQMLSRTICAQLRQDQDESKRLRKKIDDLKKTYPDGLFGLKMWLIDKVNHTRHFLYKTFLGYVTIAVLATLVVKVLFMG